MIQHSSDAEMATIMRVAQAMCAAARTAPKTRGIDYIDTCIVTGDEKDALAGAMDRLYERYSAEGFKRDAQNIRDSQAVVLIGTQYHQRGLDERCQLCNFKNCADSRDAGAVCVFDPMDLGISLGSAVAMAADMRVDNRIMYTAGKGALELNMMGENIKNIIGIPLSVTGKSPFFDR
ncbi:MAG: ferredoxin domain-containing protein [Christensenellales bacterium]|jgi:uncharacterized ferredoxin-like protein